MTHPKIGVDERESVVLQALKKHGEVSQNKLKEELAPKMAGNTVVSMLQNLKDRKQADYYKVKNKHLWFAVEEEPKNDEQETAQLHELMRRQLRMLHNSHRDLSLASKLQNCRQIAELCFTAINSAILANLDNKNWHESVDARYISYLKTLNYIIFKNRDDAEVVYRAMSTHVLRIPANMIASLTEEKKA